MKILSDQRGVALVVEVVLVAAVLAVAGFAVYHVHAAKSSKTASNSTKTATASTSSTASAGVDASCLASYHDTNLCHFASNSTNLSKQAYTANITETENGQTSTISLKNDGKGNTELSGTSGGVALDSIELAGATYLKNGSTWIKYPSGSSATTTSDPTSNMNIGVDAAGISYKKVDTEACGSLTCFKYQISETASPNVTQFAWFDNSSYLLREWKYSDGTSSSDMVISYQPVTIQTPSPVQTLGQ